MSSSTAEVTDLLCAWSNGDKGAFDKLVPLVYEELHRLARRHLGRERRNHTVQTTVLIHEAYLRLVDQKNARWQNRSQFFSISARIMRRILVDHARAVLSSKRGGSGLKVSLVEGEAVAAERPAEVVALDDALNTLAEMDPRKARVVELRFFGGLSVEETAGTLGLSPNTVIRDWSTAKAWLHREMNGGPRDGD